MYKSLLTALFLLLASFAICQETFQLPRDGEGRLIASEKFEMIHEYYKHLNGQSEVVKFDEVPALSLRGEGEQQISPDDRVEFEIHAIVNPTDPSNIIVGAMDFRANDIVTPLEFPIYVTYDFGETWEKSAFTGLMNSNLVLGGGDPMFAFDANGRLYYTWLAIDANLVTSVGKWQLNMATSDDGGMTWEEDYKPIQEDRFSDVLFLSDLTRLADKQWMVSDLSEDSPHYGNMYMAFIDIQVVGQVAQYRISVVRKLAGEIEFQETRQVLSDPTAVLSQYSSIDVANDGTVYVTWMSNIDDNSPGIQELFISSSTDGGATFSAAQKVTSLSFPDLGTLGLNIVGIDQNRLYPCPHVAVDKSDTSSEGTIYVAYTARGIDSQLTTGFDIFMTSSTDSGKTWSTPKVVNGNSDPNANQFYSSIEVNEEGTIALGWYDTRSDVNRTLTKYYMGYSENGGSSFIEFPVSSAETNFDRVGNLNGRIGIGEYNEILMVDDYIIPFWSDGRTADGNLAVYSNFYKIGSTSVEEKSGPINKTLVIKGPLFNPVSDKVAFILNSESLTTVDFSIHDVSGQLISSRSLSVLGEGYRVEQSVEQLESGTYLASFANVEGVWTRKFIVE